MVGRYKYMDFVRVGVIAIPIFFPF